MTTIVPSLPNLPDETQIIASFLLKYVERCILDANCLKAYEFDEVYGEPFLIEHEQSREFKKNLTCFLRAHLIDSPVTPEERIQKGIDGYNVPETIVARSSRSHLDEAGSNGSVSTIPSYPGTVGQTSELVDVRFQPSDTNYPMHPKNPDDDGIESLSSEPSKKRSRSESCVKPEREDLVDSVSQEFSKPGMRKTMSTIEAFSMRIQDIRKACETLESLESSNENTEALFMSVWRHSAIGGAGALRGTNVHQLERHIILALNMVVFAHTVREKQRRTPNWGSDKTESQMLYRGLRDHVNRQVEGHVAVEQVTARVRRAMQWGMMYDAVGWAGVLFHAWLPKTEQRSDPEWGLLCKCLRDNQRVLQTFVQDKFGDKLRELFVIDQVADLDKLIRVLKSLEDC